MKVREYIPYHANGYMYNWNVFINGMRLIKSQREGKPMQGIVEKVNQKVVQLANGPRTAYSLLISGAWYSLGFDNKLLVASGVAEKDTVEFTSHKNDKGYNNLDTLTKLAAGTVTTPATSPTTTQTKSSGGSADYSSVDRREALKVAVDLVLGFYNHPAAKKVNSLDTLLNKVVSNADHLFRYISTGKVEVLDQADAAKIEEALNPTPATEDTNDVPF